MYTYMHMYIYIFIYMNMYIYMGTYVSISDKPNGRVHLQEPQQGSLISPMDMDLSQVLQHGSYNVGYMLWPYYTKLWPQII